MIFRKDLINLTICDILFKSVGELIDVVKLQLGTASDEAVAQKLGIARETLNRLKNENAPKTMDRFMKAFEEEISQFVTRWSSQAPSSTELDRGGPVTLANLYASQQELLRLVQKIERNTDPSVTQARGKAALEQVKKDIHKGKSSGRGKKNKD